MFVKCVPRFVKPVQQVAKRLVAWMSASRPVIDVPKVAGKWQLPSIRQDINELQTLFIMLGTNDYANCLW
jgi:hypothetical protein